MQPTNDTISPLLGIESKLEMPAELQRKKTQQQTVEVNVHANAIEGSDSKAEQMCGWDALGSAEKPTMFRRKKIAQRVLRSTSSKGLHMDDFHASKHAKRRGCCSFFGCHPSIYANPGSPQIINYSSDALITFGWMSTLGTVLRSRFIWLQTLVLIAFTGLIFGYGIWNGSYYRDVDTTTLTSFVKLLHTLSTFLLSLFVSLTLTRWWNIRINCVQALWDNICDLALFSATYLNDSPEQRDIAKRIVRYGKLSFALLFKQARGQLNSVSFTQDMSDCQLEREEWQFLKDATMKAEVPLIWAFSEITQALKRGMIPDALRYDMHARCLKARTALSHGLAYIYTPLPLVYAHVITCITKLAMFSWGLNGGIVLAKAVDQKNDTKHFSDVWLDMFLQIVVPIIYQACLELHRKLSNPFQVKSSGFPETTYRIALDEQCRAIMKTAMNTPTLKLRK